MAAAPSAEATWPRRLASASPWAALAALGVVRLATVYGPGTTPNLSQWLLFAADPWGDPAVDPAAGYLTGSIIGPVLAHAAGLTGRTPYLLLHGAVVVLAACVAVALAERLVGRVAATAVAVVLFASPVSNVLLSWLGQPDPFVLLAGSLIGLAGLARSPVVAAALAGAGGLVGGLASFEQAAIATVLVAVLAIPGGRREDRVALIAALAGVVAGRLGVAGFHAVSDAPFATRVQAAQAIGAGPLIWPTLRNLPTLVWSLLGAGWILAAAAVRARPTLRVPGLLLLVGGLVVAAIGSDQTRVATLVLWAPVVRLTVDHVGPAPDDERLRVVGWTLLLGLVIPPLVVWSGEVYVTNF